MTGMTTWIRREPIRFLMGLQGTLIAIINGLVIFEVWDPTAEQVSYLNGFVIALATAWGFTSTRSAVAVRNNVIEVAKAINSDPNGPTMSMARMLWPDAA